MNILVFDTEHTEGIYRPWKPGFELSCIHYLEWRKFNDQDVHDFGGSETLWFDHVNIPSELLSNKNEAWLTLQTKVDQADVVIGHNLKHDINIARYLGGINFDGKILWDTMVTDYLIHGQDTKIDYNLDAVAERRGIKGKIDKVKEYWNVGVHTKDIPWDELELYVRQDVQSTYEIYLSQVEEVKGDKIGKVIAIQNEFILSLSDMEVNGLKIDREKGVKLYEETKRNINQLEKQVLDLINNNCINLKSNDHLSAVMYGGVAIFEEKRWVVETLKSKPESKYREKTFKKEVIFPRLFEPIKGSELKKKGYYSTNKEIIEQLKCKGSTQRKLKTLLLEISKLGKFMETLLGEKEDAGFLNKVELDGCVHTEFFNSFTSTGRLSSRNPNGQNLPRESTSGIKSIIVPQFDYIFQWDLSQIEWRDAAWLAHDEVMIHEINSGVDQHIAACVDLMELPFISKDDSESKMNRFYAKIFNFRMIYGGSWWGFFLDPKMPRFSKKKWREICENFYKKYFGLKNWQDKNIASVWSNSGLLIIPTGRRFQFNKIMGKDGVETYPENKIKNYPVQGMSGADILPLLCIIIRRGLIQMGLRSRLILTVHDSIVFDVLKEELERVRRLCQVTTKLLPMYISNFFDIDWNVNLDGEGEYGPNYGELKILK